MSSSQDLRTTQHQLQALYSLQLPFLATTGRRLVRLAYPKCKRRVSSVLGLCNKRVENYTSFYGFLTVARLPSDIRLYQHRLTPFRHTDWETPFGQRRDSSVGCLWPAVERNVHIVEVESSSLSRGSLREGASGSISIRRECRFGS